MERGVGEAVRANPNTTKRSKKFTIPIQILYQKSHKNNPNQNKNQEIKPKKLYYYEPTKRGEIRN
jgi:hypothetical protein